MDRHYVIFVVTMTSYFKEITAAINVKSSAQTTQQLTYNTSMLTRSQQHVVNAGGKVFLDCEFHMHNLSMFDNPIVWEKQQLGEKTKLNIMGVVQEPFAATRRYDVLLTSQPPRYRIRLRIKDVAIEDSGNYTCEIRGRKSLVLSKVLHTVLVRAPIKWIYVVLDEAGTTAADSFVASSGDQHPLVSLVVNENQPVSVRCLSHGGHPEPKLSLAVGDRDVTSLFVTVHSANTTGQRGLRTVHHRLSSWTSSFTATADDHGKDLRCSATVDGIGETSSNVTLIVNYEPKVTCQSSEAEVGDLNVKLHCHVTANPSLTSLYWMIDHNVTVAANGDSPYVHLVRDMGGVETATELKIRRVYTNSFRVYTLHAENALGQTKHAVKLQQKYIASRAPEASTATHDLQENLIVYPSRGFVGDHSELRMSTGSDVVSRDCQLTLLLIASSKAVAFLQRIPR